MTLRRTFTISALVIGLGMIAAPAVFGMFSRAPDGAAMIDDFRPFMTPEKVTLFRGYLAEIDAADTESRLLLEPALTQFGVIDSAEYQSKFASLAGLNESWPAIEADMTDLVDRMADNLDSYAAVDALPNFKLFPWFFVAPGVLIAAVAAAVLVADRRGASTKVLLRLLAGLGVAVVLAPAVFQMFERAPKGGDMIEDFRPMMTVERVRAVQGYFITMGAAEGQLRNGVLPLAAASADLPSDQFVSITQFSEDWPEIVVEFAPMISAMSDNVDNFAGVDALPPFAMFPWFFVAPGLLVEVLAILSERSPKAYLGIENVATI